MDIKFLKQFKLTPVQGFRFDNYCYGLASKKIRNFTGGQWNTAKVGDLIVLLPPSQGDTLTMGAAYSDVTADRLTVGAAFTLLLVGALVFGLAAFYAAGYGVKRLKLLLFLLVSSFLLVLISEFVGRTIFYEAMTRVGV